MAKQNPETTKKPGKFLMSIIAFFLIISNAVFLLSILINLPVIADTVNYSSFDYIANLIYSYYLYGCIGAAFLQALSLIILYHHWGTYAFPSTLSIIACAYNFVVCISFAILIYIIDLKNVYFSLQILYLIPIITIFLSWVFVLDDYVDLMLGTFRFATEEEHQHKKKQQKSKKGELKPATNPNKDRLLNPDDVIHVHQTVISSAAEKAVPIIEHNKKTY